jgi:hypothetical protein
LNKFKRDLSLIMRKRKKEKEILDENRDKILLKLKKEGPHFFMKTWGLLRPQQMVTH